jgi:hypothetical protein
MEKEGGRKREGRARKPALGRRPSPSGPQGTQRPAACPPKGGAAGTVHGAEKCKEGGQGLGGLGREVLAAVADDVEPAVRRRGLPAPAARQRRAGRRAGSRDGSRSDGGGGAAAGTRWKSLVWWLRYMPVAIKLSSSGL